MQMYIRNYHTLNFYIFIDNKLLIFDVYNPRQASLRKFNEYPMITIKKILIFSKTKQQVQYLKGKFHVNITVADAGQLEQI